MTVYVVTGDLTSLIWPVLSYRELISLRKYEWFRTTFLSFLPNTKVCQKETTQLDTVHKALNALLCKDLTSKSEWLAASFWRQRPCHLRKIGLIDSQSENIVSSVQLKMGLGLRQQQKHFECYILLLEMLRSWKGIIILLMGRTTVIIVVYPSLGIQ